MAQADSTFTTRRALIGGAAALVPAAVVQPFCVDIASATPLASPDAEIVALVKEAVALGDRFDIASNADRAANSVVNKWLKANPYPEWRIPMARPGDDIEAVQLAAQREHERAVKTYRQRLRVVFKQSGAQEASFAADQLESALIGLCERIAEMRATTLVGLSAKAALWYRYEYMQPSITDDLLALTGDNELDAINFWRRA